MAAVTKGAKINFYKFVNTGSVSSSKGQTEETKETVKVIKSQVEAINNLGTTVNSISKMLVSLNTIAYEDLKERKAKNREFKPVYTKKEKKPLANFVEKLTDLRVPSFMEGIFNLLGALFKGILMGSVLKWLSDPKNQEKIKTLLDVISKVVKFIWDWGNFAVNNILDGLYMMLSDDTSWWEKLVGFGKTFIGLGALLLGIRWLSNPLKIITDFGNVLKLFWRSLGKGKVALAAKVGALGLVAGAAVLATAAPAGGSMTSEMDAEGRLPGDPGYDKETRGEVTPEKLAEIGRGDLVEDRLKELGKSEEPVPPADKAESTDPSQAIQDSLGSAVSDLQDFTTENLKAAVDRMEAQYTRTESIPETIAAGFDLPQMAKGGFIQGPQSGYPVSLDGGKSTAFIGHGTEYVARKADGGAFVLPIDTPATKAMPKLTSMRLNEGENMGFKFPGFASGGSVAEKINIPIPLLSSGGSISPLQREALEILAKYESKGTGQYNAVNQMGLEGGRGTVGFAGDFREMHQHNGRSLTDMTIAEIKALQYDNNSMSNSAWIKAGKLHAVGRYQFVGNTLPGVAHRAGVPDDAKFTKQVQDLMALQLMKERGISPWVGPSDKATARERAVISRARREPIEYNPSMAKGQLPSQTVMNNNTNMSSPAASQSTTGQPSHNWFQRIGGGLLDILLGTSPAFSQQIPSQLKEPDDGKEPGQPLKTEGGGNIVAASHPDTGSGWGINGATDQSGRPIVLSNPAAKQFAKAMDASGMNLASYVASSGRSTEKNRAVGGHPNSSHMYGEGIDINGAGYEWLRKNGAKYGWSYGYNHGPGSAHFEYKGPGARTTPKLGPAGSKPAPASALEPSSTSAGTQVGNAPVQTAAEVKETAAKEFGRIFGGPTTSGQFLEDMGGMFSSNKLFPSAGTTGQDNYARGLSTMQMPMRGSGQETPADIRRRKAQAREMQRMTAQRNAARNQIMVKTNEMLQTALGNVAQANNVNRQAVGSAAQGIQQLLSMAQQGPQVQYIPQSSGGGGGGGGGGSSTASKLQSFINPLVSLFK